MEGLAPPQTSRETQILRPGNAESDVTRVNAIDDERLQRIVELWPTLSEEKQERHYHFIDHQQRVGASQMRLF